MKIDTKKDLKRLLGVLAGATLLALNIKTFVSAGGLFPGGATGLTVLMQRIALRYFNLELPYSVLNILINVIPVYIGFRYVGKKFTILSLAMILFTGFVADTVHLQPITSDMLLIAIFGGILNACAITLCLMMDATSGGTDFIAIYLSQKKGVDTWNLIFYFNATILVVAGYLFGWEKALYSIIFQYVSTQTISALYRNYQKLTLFVITDYPNEMAAGIHEVCHHGASIMHAMGAFERKDRYMVYSVISSADVKKVKSDSGFDGSRTICLYPMLKARGKKMYASAYYAAMACKIDSENGFIPNITPSNKPADIDALVLSDGTEMYLDKTEANSLNAIGVVTALNFNGFRFWGNNTAAYPGTKDPKDRWIGTRRFFSWWGNTFAVEHFSKVDSLMNSRLIEYIVDSANIKGNALVAQEKCAGIMVEYKEEDNSKEKLLDGKITFRHYLAPYTPAEYIEAVLEYDVNMLLTAIGGK